MLNEVGEYEHYTLSPEKLKTCKDRRLKHYTLIKQDLGGLERVMTIIARHFIFDTPVGFNEEELREILKSWCGFNHAAKTKLPEYFDGWLSNYIRRVLMFEALQNLFKDENFPAELIDDPSKLEDANGQIKNLLDALAKLSNKNIMFSKSCLGSLDKKSGTPFRAITYDKILANALLSGKLRRYHLACDEELFRTKKILKVGGKNLSAKDKDIVLKMTAEYLLQRRYTAQKFVVTNNADLANWIVGKQNKCSEQRENYLLAGTSEKIFETAKVDGINVIKVKLNPEWTKHFRLIEYDSDDKWGRIFFSDSGSSEVLIEKNI